MFEDKSNGYKPLVGMQCTESPAVSPALLLSSVAPVFPLKLACDLSVSLCLFDCQSVCSFLLFIGLASDMFHGFEQLLLTLVCYFCIASMYIYYDSMLSLRQYELTILNGS
ncbi:hypothetical protein Droror1_Dr00010877 [Drosera rotundifolia]